MKIYLNSLFCVIIPGFNLFQSREKLGSILVTLQEVLAVETASNINNQIELSLFVLLVKLHADQFK